ncbi:MAG: hypothetical protein JRF37_04185, partial [Deltaproteobacteria bacterium]|nr:hypothetical protein [Deltaproteobacteria bacterium]
MKHTEQGREDGKDDSFHVRRPYEGAAIKSTKSDGTKFLVGTELFDEHHGALGQNPNLVADRSPSMNGISWTNSMGIHHDQIHLVVRCNRQDL